MTVKQLIELAKGQEDLELTVRKHDKEQLCCNCTVPIERAYPGFDWTDGQFILEPKIELVTSADEISKSMHDKLVDYSHRLTQHLLIAARISMLLKDIPDESLRNKIHDLLKQI